jgi:hypothetical protein
VETLWTVDYDCGFSASENSHNMELLNYYCGMWEHCKRPLICLLVLFTALTIDCVTLLYRKRRRAPMWNDDWSTAFLLA